MTILGNQIPTYQWVPESFSDASFIEAMEVADRAKIVCDPWQKTVLHGGLSETKEHRFTCFEVCCIVGRQNGKGGIIEVRELAGLFAFGEKLITHSAHEFKTSGEAFRRMLVFIESVPEFDAQVMRISRSKGEEGIELRGDRRLRYMARTGGAGRGFTGDLVVLDEAMILDDGPISALVPTMATRPDPQIWYMGSAGDRRLPTQSKVLARVRRRGLSKDPAMALFMWEAHRRHIKGKCKPGCKIDPRDSIETWGKTNPAMGIRIQPSFLQKMIGTLAGWDFDREFLGAGDYPEEEGWVIINKATWEALYAPYTDMEGAFAIGIEARFDGSAAAIAIAARRSDNMVQLEVVKHGLGTKWIIGEVHDQVQVGKRERKKRPCAIVINPKGPAQVILPGIEKQKIRRLYKPPIQEIASWCAKWLQMVVESEDIRHGNQAILNDAVAAARRRELGQGTWMWEHENVTGDVCGLDAATLALGGLLKFEKRGHGGMVASV